MYSSTDLGEVTFIAAPHTKGQPRQQHIRVENGVNRDLLDLFRSYLSVFQEDIGAIERSNRPDANIVVTMTDKVKTAQMANTVADRLVERVRSFISKQHRLAQNQLVGNGFAVHSDVKAYHGSGD